MYVQALKRSFNKGRAAVCLCVPPKWKLHMFDEICVLNDSEKGRSFGEGRSASQELYRWKLSVDADERLNTKGIGCYKNWNLKATTVVNPEWWSYPLNEERERGVCMPVRVICITSNVMMKKQESLIKERSWWRLLWNGVDWLDLSVKEVISQEWPKAFLSSKVWKKCTYNGNLLNILFPHRNRGLE